MISVGFKTDKGHSRQENEDSVFVMPDKRLFIVADGVGGHNSGELASRMTVGYMAQYVALNPMDGVESPAALKAYFLNMFNGANELVYGKSKSETRNRGMATTALLCYLKAGRAYVVNVGDSRCYLIRDGALLQVTSDHTVVQEMRDKGLLDEEDVRQRNDKNVITRAIGGEAAIRPDFFVFNIYAEDTIILCTDGLYTEIDSDVLAVLASGAKTMHGLSSQLVALANKQGGSDNISVVCIRIS